MKHCNAPEYQTTRHILRIACATALAVAFTVSLPQPAHAGHITPPAVPSNIQVPAGNKVFLEGHAVGTQDYICLPSGSDFSWTFFGPQATLFNPHRGQQIITHFLSPNPMENGMPPRATWQHSRDTSMVWALADRDHTSSDPRFVMPSAIPWLLLKVVGAEPGPTDGDRLTETTFIQRLNTSGGVAPATGCAQPADVGTKALVLYEAHYFFYKAAGDGH